MFVIDERDVGLMFEEVVTFQRNPGSPEEWGIVISKGVGAQEVATVIDKKGKVVFKGHITLKRGRGHKRLTIFVAHSGERILINSVGMTARGKYAELTNQEA